MNNEERQQNLGRLFLTCNTLDELNEFARQFNSQYKIMIDHMNRMNDIDKAIKEMEKQGIMKVGYVEAGER